MTRSFFAIILLSIILFGLAFAVVSFAEQLPANFPIAIDWRALHRTLQSGIVSYENELALYAPPWIRLLLLPLGLLSMRVSWAIIALFTVIVLLLSVPRTQPRWRFYAGILLLQLSFPALRHTIDGNFEGIVIAGVLLALWGYQLGLKPQSGQPAEWYAPAMLAAGTLLATTKPQLSIYFLLVMGLTTLYLWPWQRILRALGIVLAVVVPFMLWMGQTYITKVFAIIQRGSIMDISLMAALNRMLLPSSLIVILWLSVLAATVWLVWVTRPQHARPAGFSRERAGLLIAASLLLSPYSAGNSMLTLLAVGIIPLFLKRPLLGLLLIVPINLTILLNNQAGLAYQAYYTTAVLLLCWGVLAYWVYRTEKRIRTGYSKAQVGA